MSVERLRLVFRVKLAADKPRMNVARQLDHLDKLAIGRHAAEHQTFLFEPLSKLRIKLVTMSMTLADLVYTTINSLDQRAGRQPAGPCAESHRAAELLDVHEISQFKNNRVRRFDIEFSRIGVFQLTNIPRVLDTGGLHSQTNTEERRARLARVVDRANHSRDATLAEAAGHKDRIEVAQTIFVIIIVHQLFRLDPFHIDSQIVGHAAVREGFAQRLVRVFKLDILTDNRDLRFTTRGLANRRHKIAPLSE